MNRSREAGFLKGIRYTCKNSKQWENIFVSKWKRIGERTAKVT